MYMLIKLDQANLVIKMPYPQHVLCFLNQVAANPFVLSDWISLKSLPFNIGDHEVHA